MNDKLTPLQKEVLKMQLTTAIHYQLFNRDIYEKIMKEVNNKINNLNFKIETIKSFSLRKCLYMIISLPEQEDICVTLVIDYNNSICVDDYTYHIIVGHYSITSLSTLASGILNYETKACTSMQVPEEDIKNLPDLLYYVKNKI